MKAFLVMDMPSKCAECPCIYFNKYYKTYECRANMNYWKNVDFEYEKGRKPDWCPLKPMPNKKSTEYNPCRNSYMAEGYNACIDEILGGSEE